MSSRPLPRPQIISNTQITGQTVQIDSANLRFGYPYININTLDAGPGVTSTTSGLIINRGTNQPPAEVVWNDATRQLDVGVEGATLPVGPVADASTAGIKRWNGTAFTSTGAEYANALNQDVSAGATPTFSGIQAGSNGPTYNLPTSHGLSGSVLTEDGSGDLYWGAGGGGGGSGTFIATGNSSVSTSTGSVAITAGGTTTQTASSSGTVFSAAVRLAGGVGFGTPTSVVQQNYTVQDSDTVIRYTTSVDGTVNLPPANGFFTRLLAIENVTPSSVLTISPNGGDTIDGTTDSITLDATGATTAVLIGDGYGNWILG